MVLLLGLVFAGAAVVAVTAAPLVESTESTAERERATQSMQQFALEAGTVAAVGDADRTVAMGPYDRGRVETRETAGRVRIVHVTDGERVLYEADLGAVVYAQGDETVAYQGGAVWRAGDGRTTVVSPPEVAADDEGLSFPVIRVTGDVGPTDRVEGRIGRAGSPTDVEPPAAEFGPRSGAGRIAPGAIRVEIESAYCDGWERTLGAEFDRPPAEACDEGVVDRVVFEFPVPLRLEGVDAAVVAHEVDVHESAPPVEGDVRAETVDEGKVRGEVHRDGYDYPSADAVVASKIAACDGSFDDLDPGETIDEPGLYCVDRLTGSYAVDTSEGDVEVVVREGIGDPNYQGEIDVEGSNDLTIYVDGDLHARGSASIGNASAPARTKLVFADGTELSTAKGSPTIDAVLYAPDSRVHLQGSPSVTGTVIANRVEVENIRPGTVAHAEGVADRELVVGDGAGLVSVDVTVYELEVSED